MKCINRCDGNGRENSSAWAAWAIRVGFSTKRCWKARRVAHRDDLLSIGELAERTGLATSALRFYEDRGLIRAERTEGGQRRFHREVVRRVSFVRAARGVGLTLDEIVAALDQLPDARTPTVADWARISRRWQALLDERIERLELLRDTLTGCIGCGCLSLRTCALYNPDDVAATLGAGPRYLLGDSSADVVPS